MPDWSTSNSQWQPAPRDIIGCPGCAFLCPVHACQTRGACIILKIAKSQGNLHHLGLCSSLTIITIPLRPGCYLGDTKTQMAQAASAATLQDSTYKDSVSVIYILFCVQATSSGRSAFNIEC